MQLKTQYSVLLSALVFLLALFIGGQTTNAATLYYDSSNASQVTIINYHHFGYEGEYPQIENIRVAPEQFKEQLLKLKNAGYSTITETQLINYMNGTGMLPKKALLITIDDGYQSVYNYAFPILKELNMHAVFFPIISEIEKGTRLGAPMITWEQLTEIAKTNVMEFGNHTYNLHWRMNDQIGQEGMIYPYNSNGKLYTSTERLELIKEDLTKAENVFYENTGYHLSKSISYPYGAYDQVVLKAVKQLGFKIGYTVIGGYNMPSLVEDTVLTLNRHGINHKNDTSKPLNILNTNTTNANKKLTTRNVRTSLTINKNKTAISVKTWPNKGYNTVKSIKYEIWERNGYTRKFIQNSSVKVPTLTKKKPFYTYTQVLTGKKYYNKNKPYALKAIMKNKDGSVDVEWVNY